MIRKVLFRHVIIIFSTLSFVRIQTSVVPLHVLKVSFDLNQFGIKTKSLFMSCSEWVESTAGFIPSFILEAFFWEGGKETKSTERSSAVCGGLGCAGATKDTHVICPLPLLPQNAVRNSVNQQWRLILRSPEGQRPVSTWKVEQRGGGEEQCN